jgi:dTMP kinase
MNGRFIALEGPDGSGKTTQLNLLAERLRDTGRDVLLTREPGGTSVGESVRQILLSPTSGEMTPLTELLLFMSARAELTARVIRPALEAGKIVLSDRFLLSSVAYQGAGGALGEETVQQVGRIATAGVLPHLSVVVDVPCEVSRERRDGRGRDDRMEAKGAAYHARVRQAFLDAAQRDPEHVCVIDGCRSVEAVAADVWSCVTDALESTHRT